MINVKSRLLRLIQKVSLGENSLIFSSISDPLCPPLEPILSPRPFGRVKQANSNIYQAWSLITAPKDIGATHGNGLRPAGSREMVVVGIKAHWTHSMPAARRQESQVQKPARYLVPLPRSHQAAGGGFSPVWCSGIITSGHSAWACRRITPVKWQLLVLPGVLRPPLDPLVIDVRKKICKASIERVRHEYMSCHFDHAFDRLQSPGRHGPSGFTAKTLVTFLISHEHVCAALRTEVLSDCV
ncbi:hypothetical protein KC335_g72 [Hortaea werneckii]|nr:hypothetical protein KC335_g72 [Hortaea werneckii]